VVIRVHDGYLWKGNKTGVSEHAYGLGRGPWHPKRIAIGESARLPVKIAKISYARRGAATGDEVALRVHGVFSPPMGMEREDRGEQAGL